MAAYTDDSVARVKEAVDMVALVAARTDLRRVGSNHLGLCPFHDERTPSFSVSPDRGLYHCFGCGESGDAIRFVQATEGLDFREAVELLGERYGVELKREHEDPRAEERRRRRERLLRLLERTAAYYGRYLWDSGEAGRAREYLAGRGLEERLLRDFGVGYAPSAWDRVLLAAQRDGFSVEEIAGAGLGQRGSRGGFYDRFRGRIMFPLADARGRVLGFGARALREDQRPKYINTSENELYHKGRQLFGIDRARVAAAKAGRIIVVEGYTDVLALHQAGVAESVAIMGTALTQEQVAELARAAPAVYLALDADRSGQEAMLRAARAARGRGLDLRVVGMPDERDPADLVAAEGAQRFLSLLDAAMSVPEFEVRRALAAAELGTPAGRDRALAEVRPLVGAVPERTATRDELVRYVADRLDVPAAYVTTELSTARSPAATGPRAARGAGDPSSDVGDSATAVAPQQASSMAAIVRAERAFLAMCVGDPRLGRRYLARLRDEHLSSPALARVRGHLVEHLDDPLTDLPADDPPVAAAITDIVAHAAEERSSEAALRLSFLQLELRRIDRALRGERDFQQQRELGGLREDVRTQMSDVMGETM